MSLKEIVIALIFVLTMGTFAHGQDSAKHKYPEVVLVQLSSEHNRIEALNKAKRYTEAEWAKEDGRKAAAATINDFKNNFTFCPVYYYVDTNIALVKEKQFNGILMDEDGNMVNVQPRNYFIAWYGFPVTQGELQKVVTDTSVYTYDPQSRSVRGLVVTNDKFQQVGYLYKLAYHNLFMGRKKNYFSSAHFDIEYLPVAKAFNRQLNGSDQYHGIHGTIFR
jgi:hypothetical protein